MCAASVQCWIRPTCWDLSNRNNGRWAVRHVPVLFSDSSTFLDTFRRAPPQPKIFNSRYCEKEKGKMYHRTYTAGWSAVDFSSIEREKNILKIVIFFSFIPLICWYIFCTPLLVVRLLVGHKLHHKCKDLASIYPITQVKSSTAGFWTVCILLKVYYEK